MTYLRIKYTMYPEQCTLSPSIIVIVWSLSESYIYIIADIHIHKRGLLTNIQCLFFSCPIAWASTQKDILALISCEHQSLLLMCSAKWKGLMLTSGRLRVNGHSLRMAINWTLDDYNDKLFQHACRNFSFQTWKKCPIKHGSSWLKWGNC